MNDRFPYAARDPAGETEWALPTETEEERTASDGASDGGSVPGRRYER